MPANVCGQDVDTFVTGVSYEELNNQNISSSNEEQEDEENNNRDVYLEDDIIKAALCALQTPTADSSPTSNQQVGFSKLDVIGQRSDNDDVIEIEDLPLVNEDSDGDIPTNQNTVNIELQFEDEEIHPEKEKQRTIFPENDSLDNTKKFVTSIPLVKPPPGKPIQPPPPIVALKHQTPNTVRPLVTVKHNSNALVPPQPIMYIQYIPIATQPPQMMTHFIQPPSFIPNSQNMRPNVTPVSVPPVTSSKPIATPSVTSTTPSTKSGNISDSSDEDDVPLAKISNVTSLKVATNASGTAHSTEVERSHICDICGAGFQWRSHLRRHQKTHTNEKFKCDICHSGFGQQSYLNAHYKSHFNEKPYKCEACGKRFVQSTHLKIHLMIHTGEKPYQCHFCKARFTQHGNLKRHIRVHTGERPYHCTECPASFTHSSDLTRHIRIHTGEKPYKCAHCNSAFATNGNLKSHLKTHTAGTNHFKCSLCHAGFNLESYLKLHMRTHINERPFLCACGEAFDQGLNFNCHLKARVSPFCALVT